VPSAPPQIAVESKRSRWDPARLGLVVPIGVVLILAIMWIAVTVLNTARKANDAAVAAEQQLVKQAIIDRGERALHLVGSVIASSQAVANIRDNYDAAWVDRRIGNVLADFNYNVVAVAGADDAIKYSHSRADVAGGAFDLRAEFAPLIDLLRGRLASMPGNAMPVDPAQVAAWPGRSAALIQRFRNNPAIVVAVAIGSDSDLARGNQGAPIVFGVKYINERLLTKIGDALQTDGLHELDGRAPAADERVAALTDAQGGVIARIAFRPMLPAGGLVDGVLPLFGVALLGLALLVFLSIRVVRRTNTALADGERKLRHLALHDPVSGLPNRIYFAERLEQAIRDVRGGGLTAAVFYIDLDHFKDVNDTLGHHTGDALILNVTQRLSHIMRDEDLVARLGGDEFGIITDCASDSYSLQAIAGRIIASVSAPYAISGHSIIIGASIGIAVIDRRAGDAADILRYADMALYRAKNEGRNRACIYDAAMDADLSNRKLLEGDLLQAIKGDGLRAAYQPIVNASGDSVIGVEALARWTHPTHGEIPPVRFIPIAEHSGLIIELGEWMLRRACLDGRDWPGLTVAVNVSPLQFRRSDFVELVERILTETDFDANRLELELTESTLLGNMETAELSMLRLKAIGVRFALDDFGTGYSSLLYLRRFPFDKLKIDSSFVRSIEKAPDAAAIVHAVVSLGRGLGMKVTAEGVETAEQHLFLRAAGVHSMQGYRFGRPGSATALNLRLAAPDDHSLSSPDREVALAS
jgi:diguanylate cyclase (GGDEF)-like protein